MNFYVKTKAKNAIISEFSQFLLTTLIITGIYLFFTHKQGTVKPSVALNLLSSFETKLNKLKEERKNISTAKEALEMQEPGRHNIYEEQLKITTDEIAGFRNVWNEMKEISEQLDDLKEKQWLAVKPKHMRSTLDELIEKLKKMPPKMRRYECYNYYINMLDDYVKVRFPNLNLFEF